jgi:hypothetical protein
MFDTISHFKRRRRRVGVFECELATVTLLLINPPLLYSATRLRRVAIYKIGSLNVQRWKNNIRYYYEDFDPNAYLSLRVYFDV